MRQSQNIFVRTNMTDEMLLKKAPSVFNDRPAGHLTDRYTFVPTSELVPMFRNQGWIPTQVIQQKATQKTADQLQFKKHVIRFSPESMTSDLKVNGLVPEILLYNSHNGTTKVKLELGLYRLVCSNGLIIADSTLGSMKVKHSNITLEDIQRAIATAFGDYQRVYNQIDDYKTINLTKIQKYDFARNVIEDVWGMDSVIEPDAVLHTRRYQDQADDLFTVFNTIQENVLKGGIVYRTNSEHSRTGFRKTRGVSNLDRDYQINTLLWGMMDHFRKNGSFK